MDTFTEKTNLSGSGSAVKFTDSLVPIGQYAARESISTELVEECGRLGIIQIKDYGGKRFVVDDSIERDFNAIEYNLHNQQPADTTAQTDKLADVARQAAEVLKNTDRLPASKGGAMESEMMSISVERTFHRPDGTCTQTRTTSDAGQQNHRSIVSSSRDISSYNGQKLSIPIIRIILLICFFAVVAAAALLYVERDNLLLRLGNSNVAINKLVADSDLLVQRSEVAQEELKKSARQVQRFQDELALSSQKVDSLKNETAQYQQKVDSLQGQSAEYRTELERFQGRSADYQQKMKALEGELTQSQEKVKQVQEKLLDARSKLAVAKERNRKAAEKLNKHIRRLSGQKR